MPAAIGRAAAALLPRRLKNPSIEIRDDGSDVDRAKCLSAPTAISLLRGSDGDRIDSKPTLKKMFPRSREEH